MGLCFFVRPTGSYVVCCSVPDGNEHLFPWIYGCHQACVGANATMFRIVLEQCLPSFHSTFDAILLCGTDTFLRSPSAHDSFRVLFRRTLKSVVCGDVSSNFCSWCATGWVGVLLVVCEVRTRVDDETNESLRTLCQVSWPKNSQTSMQRNRCRHTRKQLVLCMCI